MRRADAVERVSGIGLVAVEEMFGIEQRLAAFRGDGRNRFRDDIDIFVARDFQRDIDMEIPGLADETNRVGLCVQHGGKSRIVGGAAAGPLGHAEGGEPRACERRPLGKEVVSVGLAPGQPPST